MIPRTPKIANESREKAGDSRRKAAKEVTSERSVFRRVTSVLDSITVSSLFESSTLAMLKYYQSKRGKGKPIRPLFFHSLDEAIYSVFLRT